MSEDVDYNGSLETLMTDPDDNYYDLDSDDENFEYESADDYSLTSDDSEVDSKIDISDIIPEEQIVVDLSEKIKESLSSSGDFTPDLISLFSLIQMDASMIQKIENYLDLPVTGDLKELKSNFPMKHYFPQFSDVHPPIFFLFGAIKYQHLFMVQTVIPLLPKIKIEKAIEEAILLQHFEIAQFLMGVKPIDLWDVIEMIIFRKAKQLLEFFFDNLISGKIVGKETDSDVIKSCIDFGIQYSLERGHIDLAQFLIEKYSFDFENGLIAAIRSGKTEVLHFVIQDRQFSTATWNEALLACRKIKMAKMCLQFGATDIYGALRTAIDIGSRRLVKFFLEQGINENIDDLVEKTFSSYKITKLMVPYITNFNKVFISMAAYVSMPPTEQIDILKRLILKGANAFTPALKRPVQSCNTLVVKFLIEKGAKGLNQNLKTCMRYYNNGFHYYDQVIELLIQAGATLPKKEKLH